MLFSWLALAFILTASPLTATPAQAAEDAFQKACKLYNSGKLVAAKDAFIAFIEVICARPDFWPARYQLGNCYMQSGHMLEASMEYDKCLEETTDAKTRKNCLKALAYIKERTGHKFSDEAEKQLAARDR
jgi:TolA-binding protein